MLINANYYLVVSIVPHVVLEVEDQDTGGLVPNEFEKSRREVGHDSGRGPDPLGHGGRQNEQNMVPKCQTQGIHYLGSCHLPRRLDFVFLVPTRLRAEDVDQHEGDAEIEVEGDGEKHREQGGAKVFFIPMPHVPDRLKDPIAVDK